MSGDSMDRYEAPDEWDEVDRLDDVFASGHHEEWDMAVQELREVLKAVEDVDFRDWDDRADAEEAIEMRLPDVQLMLHDAFDSVKTEIDE